ncbi:MAG: lipoprotein signal peptidase [Prolixibacteraceae bacterium]|jgi:signal peptidase II|nr:lipoprotein signal peptidase [Prolixibacteraceae bacterium]MBT6766870.1 lipoprotein signal peptidase [Prolixibacteraceae bacterium]MBT6999858.1 lipoprotein signal peptidase [Prolixibacteraceae bacterium]MBT7396553.1 lipoprotein signal peptidase [Prolixibacteraceae bacterium]
MNISRRNKLLIVIFLILITDQILKIWIKTSMSIGDEIVLFKWFILHFVENNGMAFGFEFAGEYGKISLSIFRIIAVVAIGWYLFKLAKQKEIPFGFIMSISFIFAGAIGNIIDSLFYGLIFNHSFGQVATLFPEGGGYAGFLHGKVVDMFYFPLINGYYPDWFPFWGGNQFIFFRPVFNIADSSITIGIFAILIFYRKYFNKTDEEVQDETHENPTPLETSSEI